VVLGAVAWGLGAWVLLAVGGLVVQGALLVHETVFIRAGQDVPLS
jgi:hypothetical protein